TQLAAAAERGTDDVEAYTLKAQQITTVEAAPASTQVTTGNTTNVVVTVKDADNQPIAGAQVRSSAGGSSVYTDADGKATLTQGAGTAYYYANGDADPAFNANNDKRSTDVVVTDYTPAATSLAPVLADGTAFDRDEYSAATDVAVQIKDQQNNDITTTGRTVDYYWVLTPFDGSPASVRFPTTGNNPVPAVTANGKAIIPLPTGGTAESGTYELFAGLQPVLGSGAIATAKVATLKVGQATISYDDGSPQQALAGGTAEIKGKLALEDGTGLTGRLVDLTYTRGTETDPAGAGDAGLVQANGSLALGRQVTTTANGAFAAQVKDPAETPQPVELGGSLDAATAATPNIGNAGASTTNHKVDFVKSITPGNLVIADATPLDGNATPGRPVNSSVTLKTADGTALANQTVTLKVDKGFFTTYAATKAALVPDPAAAVGADAGEWKSNGTEIQVKTDASGVANFTLAIERDSGFDDDGAVTATVTATATSATATKAVQWSSGSNTVAPLNGGEVKLELSPAAIQEVKKEGLLPKAPTSDKVFMDVTVTDQYGNKVGGQTVNLTDNVGNADLSAASVVSDFALDGDFSATSSVAQDQVVTAAWTAPTNKYTVITPAAVITPGTEALSASATVNWYTVDFAASTFGLVSTPKNPMAGQPVTVTYGAADQNGEPISDLYVQFFRTGPDAQQDGEGNFDGVTGQDGLIQYVFQGANSGKATVAAVGRKGSASGDLVPQAQRSTTIDFGTAAPVRTAIKPKLTTKNVKKGDKIVVKAPAKAKGAKVTVFKIVNGKRVRVAQGNLNLRGGKQFVIKDRNGNKVTRYVAVIGQTKVTKRATTPVRGVK
ncbi:hypothetical protein, partial [Nocardioides sp. R-C-SC26]|uniref:hypothetical protein n=1 Tax=Nocardioides sp. R-C-SC26 TaxID=2870414 RepID=UPI001E376B6F